ncbi:hypothetical protein A5865_001190 [Enterococcus sp. 12E11_DIV0728]|nr:hypothetical protein A5865_001190 [Enterococcus sp. 12E11_DIV0728]
MPHTKSPLRYPGGKTQLWKFVDTTIKQNNIIEPIYCEPFAGGAGVAIELLPVSYTHLLGEQITVVSGRNGTMKSTLMGLVSQPYRTSHRDINDKLMQTKFSDVFKLSEVKDQNDYVYHLMLNVDNDLYLKEPVPLYYQPGNPNSKFSKKGRHRLVPSGRAKGDGYFNLPSVYINLKR